MSEAVGFSNVQSVTYAGFWRRFLASVIDFFIILIPAWIASMVIPMIGGIVIACLYKPVFESSWLKGTPGKAMLGLQVQMEDGSTMKLAQAFGRYFLSYVSALFMCLGYLIQPFTARRQTFHDLVIQTVVIEKPQASTVSYLDIWLEQIRMIFGGESDQVANSSSQNSKEESKSSAQAFEASAHVGESSENIEKLEKLHQLLQQGVLTEEEFNLKKSELLKKI